MPAASRAVMTAAAVYADLIKDGAPVMLTKDCARETAPGLTVMVGRVVVTAEPPIVAPIEVAVPESTPVKVAV